MTDVTTDLIGRLEQLLRQVDGGGAIHFCPADIREAIIALHDVSALTARLAEAERKAAAKGRGEAGEARPCAQSSEAETSGDRRSLPVCAPEQTARNSEPGQPSVASAEVSALREQLHHWQTRAQTAAAAAAASEAAWIEAQQGLATLREQLRAEPTGLGDAALARIESLTAHLAETQAHWLEDIADQKRLAAQLTRVIRRTKELGFCGEQADDELAVDGTIRALERLDVIEPSPVRRREKLHERRPS